MVDTTSSLVRSQEEFVRLDGADVTLVLLLHQDSLPEIAYWGQRLPDALGTGIVSALERPTTVAGLDREYPQATLLPTAGLGIFRSPAFAAHRQGHDWTAAFTVHCVELRRGGLLVRGGDAIGKIGIEIELALPNSANVLSVRSSVVNLAKQSLNVERLAAGVFLIPTDADEALAFGGAWGREFVSERFVLPAGLWATENRRGRTSHDRPPLLFIGARSFGEEHGIVYGFHLGWSGNHRIAVEVLEDGRRLASLEPLLHPGEVILGEGENFRTPWAHATLTTRGLGEASRRFHAKARSLVNWPNNSIRPRPVTLNTWEGNYFQHDVEALKAQASAAASLGIERFVLDDGWFGRRYDDRSSLGDWFVDRRKYPDGLNPLIEHVGNLGMEFGLWVEPEMMNPDSDLFRAHPEWALQVEGRSLDTGRNQLVLDLTREDAFEHIFRALHDLLSSHAIAYLKWDMNRDLLAAGGESGRPAYHRQVEAFYALVDRLRKAHPNIEIESCASGGGRIDFGVLARTHRFWTSDCTDALERVSIQSGFLRLMPPELMGAHVSANPSHQTGRHHGLGFRAAVALLGHFGVELNPLRLSESDASELKAWVTLHKELRPLLHTGEVVQCPIDDGRRLIGVVSHARATAAYIVVQETVRRRRSSPPYRLPGLDPERFYRVTAPSPQRPSGMRCNTAHKALWGDGLILSGAILSRVGLSLPLLLPESALVMKVDAV
jgi:alpha-galactosidase